MIFVTTGTQEPFDRLIRLVDMVAGLYPQIRFVAQVAPSGYQVKNMETFHFLSPTDFERYFKMSRLIVSHAGMGTIISALVGDKPLLIFPRLAKFHEHRNDHQLATARQFGEMQYVNTAFSEEELIDKLKELINSDRSSLHKIGLYASDSLLSAIKAETAPSDATRSSMKLPTKTSRLRRQKI
jgi:exopolysaccharide biosynthesis glucuronosyltransferase PssE